MPTATHFRIPEITDERIAELANRIVHVGRHSVRVGLFRMKRCHLRNEACLWNGTTTTQEKGLKELARIRTLHTYGHPMMFKPSVAEVLAQIPAELIADTAAFMIAGPSDAAALNDDSEALNAGFHVATTILYSR